MSASLSLSTGEHISLSSANVASSWHWPPFTVELNNVWSSASAPHTSSCGSRASVAYYGYDGHNKEATVSEVSPVRSLGFQASVRICEVGNLFHNSRSTHNNERWHSDTELTSGTQISKFRYNFPLSCLSLLKCKKICSNDCVTTLERSLWTLTSTTKDYRSMWFVGYASRRNIL